MNHPGYIKCKYCDHKVRAWYTSKTGNVRSGWPSMADHVMRDHPEHEDEAMGLAEDYSPFPKG